MTAPAWSGSKRSDEADTAAEGDRSASPGSRPVASGCGDARRNLEGAGRGSGYRVRQRADWPGVGLAAKPKILVRLVRPGAGVQKYCLPKAARLTELLPKSEAPTTNQAVYVNGVRTEETVPLRDGAVVMIVPQPRNAAVDEPWRATIPSFHDQTLFRQYTDILKSRRADLGEDKDAES